MDAPSGKDPPGTSTDGPKMKKWPTHGHFSVVRECIFHMTYLGVTNDIFVNAGAVDGAALVALACINGSRPEVAK